MYSLLFNHLFRHSRDIILLVRYEGIIIEANDAAVATYGYEREELLALLFQDIWAPETEFDLPAHIAQAAEQAEVEKMLHRRNDGSIFPVEIISRSTRIDGEDLLLCIIHDASRQENGETYDTLTKEYEDLKLAYEEIKVAYEELAGTTYDSFIDLSNLVLSNLKEEMARKRAELLSTTDYLTGVLNRRAFESQLKKEVNRARREDKPLGIILADIDDFKLFNDTYGHQVGDTVLKKFASFLTQKSRSYDFVGRYGGEEFILCLPGAGADEAIRIAERLHAALRAQSLHLPGFNQINICASFGVAVLRAEEIESVDSLIRRADEALYEAKAAGKNCVRFSL
ncbi:MAG: sensor domain-containing diguanylate cyclase [Bacillota bacterium]